MECPVLDKNMCLIALKFKTWNFKDNVSRYILIILSVAILAVFQFAGIPLIIVTYIVLSILSK